MDVGETLDAASASEWRAWLEANHASSNEVWLVFHARHSGKAGVSYNEAVEEALCFGWIDSIVKKLSADARAQRFTPRRPGSALSEMNKARLRRLAKAGRVRPEVLQAVSHVLDEPFEVAPDILERLQADPETWRNFEAFPDSYRRIRIGFIEMARGRPELFEQRLAYFLRMTARNRRYGMVQ